MTAHVKNLLILGAFMIGATHQTFCMEPPHKKVAHSAAFCLDPLRQKITELEREIETGHDITPQATGGRIMLIWAAQYGYERVCSLLLNRGADVNERDSDGQTALMWAVIQKKTSICTLLLAHNARIDIQRTKDHKTVLHIALSSYRENIYNLIVQHQTTVNRTIYTTLLCLSRMMRAGDKCSQLLYRQFKTLLRPHLGHYVSIEQLLNMQDGAGKKANDYKTDLLLKSQSMDCSIQ